MSFDIEPRTINKKKYKIKEDYFCLVCGSRFDTRKNLNRHFIRKTRCFDKLVMTNNEWFTTRQAIKRLTTIK